MPALHLLLLQRMGGTSLKVAIVAVGLLIGFVVRKVLKKRTSISEIFGKIPHDPRFHAFLIFVLSLGGRLAILHERPVPVPAVHDEYSYLLAADTFAHGRLTNPTPEYWTHFETYQELMHPTYMSKYPPGQGLALAAGQILFHLPFAGVLLSCALFCVALYWALLALMPRRWALLGGLIAVIQITWLSAWNNDYWGGAIAAMGGCLFLGAVVRLSRRFTMLPAAILGFSLSLLVVTRPYEGFLLAFPGMVWLAIKIARMPEKKHWISALAVFLLVSTAGATWLGYYNWRITGSPLDLPASELEHQCETVPAFIFKPVTGAKPCIVDDQKNQYEKNDIRSYLEIRTRKGFLDATRNRFVGIWSYYGGIAFILAPLGILLCWRNRLLHWLALLLAIMFVGWEAESWIEMHYYAPAFAVVYAIALLGLRAVSCWQRKQRVGEFLVFVSLLVFGVMAVIRVSPAPIRSMLDKSNRETPLFVQSKEAVLSVLQSIPGKHLVLVHYPKNHDAGAEWVYNTHDIPGQSVIWAHDLDPFDPNQPLICHYRDRHVWLIDPLDTEAWSVAQAKEAMKAIDTAKLCTASAY
jgi:hypothetical protein